MPGHVLLNRPTLPEYDRVEINPVMVDGAHGAEQRGWKAYLYVKGRRAPWGDSSDRESTDAAAKKIRDYARKRGVTGVPE